MAHGSVNLTNIKLYYQNVQGLRTAEKQEKLKNSLKNCETIDLIAFVETNFDSKINTDMIFGSEFIVKRQDRQEIAVRGHGGGLLFAYREIGPIADVKVCNELSCGVVEKKSVEDLWLRIELINGMILNLCIVYLRPQCRKEYFVQFFNKLKANFDNHNTEKFLIVGDYNFDEYRQYKAKVKINTRKGTKYDEMDKCTNGLKQINKIHNKEDKILEYVFTNVKGTVELSTFELVNVQKQHPPLIVTLNVKKTETKVEKIAKLENELDNLKKMFEAFKISHDEDIKELKIKILEDKKKF